DEPRLPFFYLPQSAADRFAKAFLGRDCGNVMASGDKSWPSIAVMLAASGRGPAQRQMKELQGVFHRVVSRVSGLTLPAPAGGADRIPMQARNGTAAVITRLVQLSSRYAWPGILSFLLLAVVSATYFTRHFAIVTDSKELLSSSLPWRQQERMLHDAFPQRIDQIIAVIDARTPEAADDA